jgi:hypothetical protein
MSANRFFIFDQFFMELINFSLSPNMHAQTFFLKKKTKKQNAK